MRRAVHRTTWLIATTIPMLLAGCADQPTSTAAPTSPQMLTRVAAPSSGVAATLDTVARALAKGLRSEEARRTLLLAMRASPMVEHKLVLQEFIATARGHSVLSHVARESGHSAAELAAMINRLPALDFYLPSQAQRRSWRASANLVVNATLQPVRGNVPGYDVQGRAVLLTPAAVTDGVTLIGLHPAEPKARRMDPQPAGDGDVIEDADDGTMAVQYVDILPNGATRVTAPASMAELRAPRHGSGRTLTTLSSCDDPNVLYCDDGGGGGGGSVGSGSVWVTDFITAYACDYYCSGIDDALEIEFKTNIDGTPEQKTYFYGVPPTEFYTQGEGWTGLNIREPAPTSTQTVTIAVWESDTGGDDEWIVTIRSPGQFPTPLLAGGDPRCAEEQGNPAYGDARFSCAFGYIWGEVNAAFSLIP